MYGDLSYGEQRDLFTSAGTGLESIFRPPSGVQGPPKDISFGDDEARSRFDITLPSSPPVPAQDRSTVDMHVDNSIQSLPQDQARRTQLGMRYRRTDESAEASDNSEFSMPQDSYSQIPSTTEQTALSAAQQNALEVESRKASGQSVIRNEDFSPIVLSLRQGSNGKSSYGASDVPPHELQQRLEKLQEERTSPAPGSHSSGSEEDPKTTESKPTKVENKSDVLEELGSFINYRRGGRSDDGSFRHHMLSSALNDTSELNPEESLQASTPKQFPTVRIEHWDEKDQSARESPDVPPPPNPNQDKHIAPSYGSSASPLKLFQTYDTFTSQTLLRRLSQFQEGAADGSASYAQIRTEQAGNFRQSTQYFNRFGAGELDGYEFHDDFSFQSNPYEEHDADKENRGPDGDSVHLPRVPIFDISHESSPSEEDELIIRRRRQKSGSISMMRRSARVEFAEMRHRELQPFGRYSDIVSTPKRRDTASEFKRPRTSPSKDPTPKRRRTLHRSDIEYGAEDDDGLDMDSVLMSHQQMQDMMTRHRERSGARRGSEDAPLRSYKPSQHLQERPRTPTPSQRSSTQRERPPLAEIEQRSPSRPSTRHSQKSHLQGQKHKTSGLGAVQSERKPSIKTEDFINEANKIMAMIRSKATLASGLTSVEESDAENNGTGGHNSSSDMDESTQEPFSRPPSREGRPPLTRKPTRQEDPELAEKLKQYEEPESGMGDMMGGLGGVIMEDSLRSDDGIVQEALRAGASVIIDQPLVHSPPQFRDVSYRDLDDRHFGQEEESNFSDGIISDPPNIRISHGPGWEGGGRTSFPFDGLDHNNQFQGVSTTGSGVQSRATSSGSGASSMHTGRSIPTGSSRGSETKKRIAPESVLHLIPDQVGNMVFDREKNIWVKRKSVTNSAIAPPATAAAKVIHPAIVAPQLPALQAAGAISAAAAARRKGRRSRASSFLPSEATSEDDPFAGIPDLSVDMTMEMMNLQRGASGSNTGSLQKEEQTYGQQQEQDQEPEPEPEPERQSKYDTQSSTPMGSPRSSGLDWANNFGMGGGNHGATLDAGNGSVKRDFQNQPLHDMPTPELTVEDEPVEHEIGIYEDRVNNTNTTPRKQRNLTISFSSPIASIIQDVALAAAHSNSDEGHDLQDPLEDELSAMLEQQHISGSESDDAARTGTLRGRRSASSLQQSRLSNTNSSRSRSGSRGPGRYLSVRGRTFMARPVSRIDEREEQEDYHMRFGPTPEEQRQQDVESPSSPPGGASGMELSIINNENSVVEDNHRAKFNRSLRFLVNTPANGRRNYCPIPEGMDAAPIISQYVGTLSLSPLSEFTIHKSPRGKGGEGDSTLPLEASYVVGNHRLVTGERSKKRDRRIMSMSTRDLVESIAEVEPFEPYWEDMRELRLGGKKLGSLHALNEFCARLDSLDVSNNEIRNLTGVPSTVRQLKVSDNQLSSLTAWSHLINLQYVDVSGNGLTSLSAFAGLVHLRSLKVDDNCIKSLDGIKFHDSLQQLRARGNEIEEVDFTESGLTRLTELDLKRNRITRVKGLEQIPCLSSVNLDCNQLTELEVKEEMPTLRYLRLDDNLLERLDVRMLPRLRLLHADRNRLARVDGFSRARKVDSLSLREQRNPQQPLDVSYVLSRVYEVRKLFLSGNRFQSGVFQPTVDFLNLQLLELANCGISSLPENLGLMMPNLRVLNINMNALADLRPLKWIPRLKRVLVAGNRISDPASLVEVLSGFGHLGEVDVRDNPVTVGFYAPSSLPLAGSQGTESGVMVIRRNSKKRSGSGASNLSNGQGHEGSEEADGEKRGATNQEEEEGEAPEQDFFTLPRQDAVRDKLYCGRLDLETRVRRRLYEEMFRGNCKRLKRLDGLDIAAKGRRRTSSQNSAVQDDDDVWQALRERGLVIEAPKVTVNGSEDGESFVDGEQKQQQPKTGSVRRGSGRKGMDESARWEAEDSFA